jgi:cell division protein FtsB
MLELILFGGMLFAILLYFFISLTILILKNKLKSRPAYNARIKFLDDKIAYSERAEKFYEENVKKLEDGYFRKQVEKGVPLEKVLRRWEVESQFYDDM